MLDFAIQFPLYCQLLLTISKNTPQASMVVNKSVTWS